MRFNNNILFLLAFVALPFLSRGQVVIKGKILNYSAKNKVYYTYTSDSVQSIITQELLPRANGGFSIKLKNTGPGTFNCSYKNLNFRFFFNDDAYIYFEIDQDKIKFPKRYFGYTGDGVDRGLILDSVRQAATVLISGDFEEVNKFYNKSLRVAYGSQIPVNGNLYTRILETQDTPGKVLLALDSLINEELNQIHLMDLIVTGEKGDLSAAVAKQYLINEAKSYYALVLFEVLLHNKHQSQDQPELTDYWHSFADSVYNNLPYFITQQPGSSDYNELIKQSYTTLRAFNKTTAEEEDLELFIYERLLGKDPLLFNDYHTTMVYKMNWLYLFLSSELLYTPTLLNAVYSLQSAYPELPQWDLLEPQIDKLKKSLVAKADSSIVFITTQYVDFASLVGQFKGHNLYVDIWATWCTPCIKAFQYNDSIQHLLEARKITRLYISVDKPAWNERWKQSVRFNNLIGYHIRANNELKETMWQTIGGIKGAIPRYLLINTKGDIFIPTSASPAQPEKLQEEINSLLIKNK